MQTISRWQPASSRAAPGRRAVHSTLGYSVWDVQTAPKSLSRRRAEPLQLWLAQARSEFFLAPISRSEQPARSNWSLAPIPQEKSNRRNRCEDAYDHRHNHQSQKNQIHHCLCHFAFPFPRDSCIHSRMIQACAGKAPLSIYRAYEFASSAHIGHFFAGKPCPRTVKPGPPSFVSRPHLTQIKSPPPIFHVAQNKAHRSAAKIQNRREPRVR